MQTIKEIRSSTGLSQVKFCEALNIPRRTLEDWEREKTTPPPYVVELIAFRVQHDMQIPKKDTEATEAEQIAIVERIEKMEMLFEVEEPYRLYKDEQTGK